MREKYRVVVEVESLAGIDTIDSGMRTQKEIRPAVDAKGGVGVCQDQYEWEA